jgi:DNA phosphorothioation-dependent restriction protein DptG
MNKNNWNTPITKPLPIYYMLTSEKVTASADGVRKGWSASNLLADTFLDKMSSYAQALDILNLLFEDNEGLMTYQEIKDRFATMEWDDEAKAFCEYILNEYQTRKRTLLEDRGTETNALPLALDIDVNSYEEFMDTLLELCIKLQSKDYPRMKHAMYCMADIRLLMRRREHKVLAFDEELLLFLIAMVTKGERVRLYELYRRFEAYGILFSFQTKNAISEYLLNLNLLERKSDSGEAQYVRIVL